MRAGESGPRPSWSRLVALALLCAVLYLPGISRRDLWRPDEVRYTEVAREMDVTGSLILPKLNGRPYADKPPLFFWLAILVKRVIGGPWDPVPARLVAAAAAAATVLLTFLTATRLGMAGGGLAAGIVLATSGEFLWMARWGAMDTLFSCLVLLSLYGYLRAREEGSRGWTAAAYLAASLAVLAKGPLALLIIAVTAGLTAARLDGPRAAVPRSLLWGIPLMLAPVLAWLVPDIHLAGGWGHAREVLFAQNLGRLSPASGAHPHPVTYYFVNFPADFLPWTLFLPGALWLLKRDRSMSREARVFLGAYFVVTFLVLSLLPPKREKYLLPIYPGAALLVGYLLSGGGGVVRNGYGRMVRVPGRMLSWMVMGSGLGMAACGLWGARVATAFVPEFAPEIAAVIGAAQTRVWLVLAGVVLAGAAWALYSRSAAGSAPAILSTAVVFWAVMTMVGGVEILPRADAFKSVREFCRILEERAGPDRPVGLYRNLFQGAFNFYLERTHLPVLQGPEDLNRFLSAPGRPAVIIRSRELKRFRRSGAVPFEVLFERRFEDAPLAAIVSPGPSSAGAGGP